MSNGPSDKSRSLALALAVFLGFTGAHRFYAGKTGTALLMLITIGGLGLWWIYDVILIAGGGFRDEQGRLLSRWDPEQPDFGGAIPQHVLDELDALRAEMAELSDRVDFAERLLAAPRPPRDEANSV